ncbi:YetF domain-containing protein, partial [Paenibacillus cremeus]|uniref:YetF domain-containing protein n=1 Tax=Paenibacillus cremeus TaxID=2163881 RepID=UPI003704A1E3
ENLRHAGYDDKWLQKKLREQGIQSIEEVFYAGVDGQGALYVLTRDRAGIESGNIYIQ